jgi:anthranilate/para-aminobenzoate synthase component I
MKGTAPRSADPGQDRALAAALLASDKDRAENLMIVDLVRNDLARLSVPGGVTVPELFRVEHFPTLHQLTSTVQARLRPGVDLLQIMAALFPGGSVTGAPKFRAMAQIAALEDSPRGPYCGTLGVLAPGGVAQFNLAIRTAWHDPAAGRLTCGLGAGITWPSDPEAEYRETLLKGRFLGLEPPATGAGAGDGD